MSELEVALEEIDDDGLFDRIRNNLRDEGGIVVRNAVEPERCRSYRTLINRTHDRLEAQCAEAGYPVHQARDGDQDKGVWSRLAYELREGQLPPGAFEKANDGYSIFDLIGNIRFVRFMAQFFEGDFRASPSAHTRRVSPDQARHSKTWQKPVTWHIDAQYHDPRNFSLNFWVPLNDCGVDAPGLQIVRDNVHETQKFVGYDPVACAFDPDRLEAVNAHVFDNFDRERLFSPALNVGDVFIIHNWTIHQSSFHEGMTKARQSCELRVIQDGWQFPEK